MKMLFIALMFSVLFASCNKTGVYGFKEGEKYISSEGAGLVYKVTKVSTDYIIVTMEGVNPPGFWYNRKLTGNDLTRFLRHVKLAD